MQQSLSKMQSLKPNLQVVHIDETGHAPSLMTPEQINLILDWLVD